MTVVGLELREMILWAGGESVEGNVSSCGREEGRGRRGEGEVVVMLVN